MTSGTGEGSGSPDPADGLDYYIPPFFPNVLETRGQGARGRGVVGHEVHSQYHNSHTIILCMPIRAIGSRQK